MVKTETKHKNPQRKPVVPRRNAPYGGEMLRTEAKHDGTPAEYNCTPAKRFVRQRNGLVPGTTAFRCGTARSAPGFCPTAYV